MGPPAKRRRTDASSLEQITWDPTARQEYLTGFHKRKQQRIQHAQKIAAEKDRLQRIANRKQIREQRKKDLDKHVQDVNAAVRQAEQSLVGEGENDDVSSDGAEWHGFEDTGTGTEPGSAHEDEYVDEDKYTTVTIEPMADAGGTPEEPILHDAQASSDASGRDVGSNASGKSARQATSVQKKKKDKFRYESKLERRNNRTRDKMKNSKAAHIRKAGT